MPDKNSENIDAFSQNSYSYLKKGWRVIGGKRCYFKSKWEANYARFLQYYKEQKIIKDWEYEAETFWFNSIKRGVRSYKPDFRVKLLNKHIEFHEVKGYMDAESLTKIKRMAKYYPEVVLRVIDEVWFSENNSKFKDYLLGWEP